MSDSDIVNAKGQYQDARNALFLMRVLAMLQRRRSQDESLDTLIREIEQKNGFVSPVPLVNQANYLMMAYMTLVYPREGYVGEVVGRWAPRLDWKRVEILSDASGRFTGDRRWDQLLRTLRNALAHGNVDIDGDKFVFRDYGMPRARSEKPAAIVAMDWEFLGQLTDEFFVACNDVLYGGRKASRSSSG